MILEDLESELFIMTDPSFNIYKPPDRFGYINIGHLWLLSGHNWWSSYIILVEILIGQLRNG